LRILILDDDRSYGALLASASKKLGHRAIIKVDAQEAVQILRNREADIALVDLEMPNGSGTSFAKTLRQNGINVPVAFCTGTCADTRLIEEAQTMGQVLPKIWTHADLRVVLSALQQESQSINRLRAAEVEIAEITENDPITPPLAHGSNPQAPPGFGPPVAADSAPTSLPSDAFLQPGDNLSAPTTPDPDTLFPGQNLPDASSTPLPKTQPSASSQSINRQPVSSQSLNRQPVSSQSLNKVRREPPSGQYLNRQPVSSQSLNKVRRAPPSGQYLNRQPVSSQSLNRQQVVTPPIADTQPSQAPMPAASQPKKRLETMLEAGEAQRETPRVSIACSAWEQVRRLCGDVMRGMTTITVRARSEMLVGEDVVVALELPDEMVVSIGARVLAFRDPSPDGKRPYQLDLIGFGGDEITYLLACCDSNAPISQVVDAFDSAATPARPAPAPAPMPPEQLEALQPDQDFDEPTQQKKQPRIPDAIDSVDSDPAQMDSKPSISWS
jgi:CheY-like chemotaxis protein